MEKYQYWSILRFHPRPFIIFDLYYSGADNGLKNGLSCNFSAKKFFGYFYYGCVPDKMYFMRHGYFFQTTESDDVAFLHDVVRALILIRKHNLWGKGGGGGGGVK